nr:twitching motility protein PilT [uncultured Acetatifactor sp.]
MDRKLKVYLDTSVISHLMQEDVPEKMADTRKLWEMFRQGVYDVCLSTVTLQEIDDCSEPKKSSLWQYLNQIEYETYDGRGTKCSTSDYFYGHTYKEKF